MSLMDETLHTKYRPDAFDMVRGHDAIKASLRGILDVGSSQAFLFSGPSGVGKTTFARIIAKEVGCSSDGIVEIDAATYSGIDAMREITSTLQYCYLGSGSARMIIIDEAHGLSKQAWQALLKSVEEPPLGVYWAFCTTLPRKVPQTIVTRCSIFGLKPLSDIDVFDLLKDVSDLEGFKISDDAISVVAQSAEGLPRRALTWLAQCADITDVVEITHLIESKIDEEGDEIIGICREMAKRGSWRIVSSMLSKLQDQDPERLRIIVCSYFSKCMLNCEDSNKVKEYSDIVEPFLEPYPDRSGLAPFLVSVVHGLL
jgi:DNA polymerase-3 subunit gamma/tau